MIKNFTPADMAAALRPVVEKAADHAEVMLDGMIRRSRSKERVEIFGWKAGVLLIGLYEAGRHEYISRFFDLIISKKHRFPYPDCGLPGYVAALEYERTKDEKFAGICRKIRHGFDEWPTDNNGEIKYDGSPDHQDIYVDGTGMATPFFAAYYSVFGEEEAKRIAALQVTNYLKYGIEQPMGYVCHGYRNSSSLVGERGWGRGTGWLMLAVGTVMRYCGDARVNELCEPFIEKTFTHLMKSKYMFSWSLAAPEGPSDTSATGMILWGVMKAKEAGLCSGVGDETVEKVAIASLGDVKGGVIYGASGESGGWGAYSEKHDENNAWGQGATLAFLAAYLKYLDK